MMKVIKVSDYKVMPWKNKLGVTSQIDIFPENAEFPGEDFLWRVSSASVQSNNPFSQFPGCDRFLAICQGEGLHLNSKELLPSQVIHFEGEEVIQGDLIHGPVVDVGLIYRRNKVKASMSFLQTSPGQTLDLHFSHQIHYVFCVEGSFRCDNLTVLAGESLFIDQPCDLQLWATGSQELKLYLIQVSRR